MHSSEGFTHKFDRGKQINVSSSRAKFSQGHSNMNKSLIAPQQSEGNEDKDSYKFYLGAKSSYRLHVQLTYLQKPIQNWKWQYKWSSESMKLVFVKLHKAMGSAQFLSHFRTSRRTGGRSHYKRC